MAKQLLRLPTVCERVGYKRSQIYALVGENLFPAPIRLGPRAVAWDSDEVDRWVHERIEQSRRVAA